MLSVKADVVTTNIPNYLGIYCTVDIQVPKSCNRITDVVQLQTSL